MQSSEIWWIQDDADGNGNHAQPNVFWRRPWRKLSQPTQRCHVNEPDVLEVNEISCLTGIDENCVERVQSACQTENQLTSKI